MVSSMSRRMKIAALPDHALMNCLVINATAPGEIMAKVSLDIDPGSIVVGRTYNAIRQCEDVTLYNENWPEVPLGDPFPRIEPKISYIQVRADLPQLGQQEQPLALKSNGYTEEFLKMVGECMPVGLQEMTWQSGQPYARGVEPIPDDCLVKPFGNPCGEVTLPTVPHGQAIGDSIAGPGMTFEEATERGYASPRSDQIGPMEPFVPEKWANDMLAILPDDVATAAMIRKEIFDGDASIFEIAKPSTIKGIVVKTEEPEPKEEEQSWRDRPPLL